MIVVHASVHDSNLDTLSEVTQLVELSHTSRDVRRVLAGLGCVLMNIPCCRIELDVGIRPDSSNIRKPCKAVKGERVSFDSGA